MLGTRRESVVACRQNPHLPSADSARRGFLLAVSDTIESVMLPRNGLGELVLLPLRACRSLAVPYLRR